MANEKRLIDANEFLEALGWADADVCEAYADCYCEWGFSRNAIEDLVQKQPTVDAVEVVHGRWSPVTYGLGVTVTRWMCSNCKKYENSYSRTSYCPNCGAKLDGDGNA